MFLGRFHHNLDAKNRLTIPVRFRELLGGGAYLLQGFDGNLMVYPTAAYERLARAAAALSETDVNTRLLKRMVFTTAQWVEVDKIGRILIPDFLREAGGLNSATVLAGLFDHFEIWSPERWAVQEQKLQDTEANAERFSQLQLTTAE